MMLSKGDNQEIARSPSAQRILQYFNRKFTGHLTREDTIHVYQNGNYVQVQSFHTNKNKKTEERRDVKENEIYQINNGENMKALSVAPSACGESIGHISQSWSFTI